MRGDGHTNTAENAFSLLKRAVIGTHHQLSIKRLQRYLSEFSIGSIGGKMRRCLSRRLCDRWGQADAVCKTNRAECVYVSRPAPREDFRAFLGLRFLSVIASERFLASLLLVYLVPNRASFYLPS